MLRRKAGGVVVRWLFTWGRRPIDPWKHLGDEAMVAWDRDVAPLITDKLECINVFIDSGNTVWHVILTGMPMDALRWHSVEYSATPPKWTWV